MHPNSRNAPRMANFTKNKEENGGYFDQYVNFDQFLMQHNIGNPSPFYSPRMGDFSSPMYSNQPTGFNVRPRNSSHYAQQQQQQQQQQQLISPVANGNHYLPPEKNILQNSNLLATASEFVPQNIANSNLTVDADEFVPNRTKTNNDSTKMESKKLEVSSKDDSIATGSNEKQSLRREKNGRIAESLIAEKLNDTHIFDEPSGGGVGANAGTILDSAGGAIKKIIPKQRNDSRDRQSTASGNRNNRRYNNSRRYEDRYDDRRGRNFRENDRYSGGGNRSSKYDRYDNNRNYQNKNENSDEVSTTNGNKPTSSSNGRINKDNNNQNSESLMNNDTKSSNIKDANKRYDKTEWKNRKPDDLQKGRRGRVNALKFDTSNCSQREKLMQEIDSGKLECLVCCERIKPFHSTWSCTNCFHIMHLNCIIKWAASSKSEEGWRCCACQNVSEVVPTDYYCFCSKTKLIAAQYSRYDVAHSCGEICDKTLVGCAHRCTLLCHPGPCPPCQAMVVRGCGCGKTSRILQCNQNYKDHKCDQKCGKTLACAKHRCEKSCHFGDCDVCDEEIEQNCYCKRDKRTVPCTKENNEQLIYSCGRICNKQLKCKNHKCKEPCHPGECGSCKLLPEKIRTCPCGKMKLEKDQRLNCKDPIPLCTAVCKKLLTCGPPSNPHTCTSKCHNGPCPPCNKQTSVKCRCGHMDQMIKCTQLSTRADDARCKKRCNKKRSCGRHKCNQECCIDIDHECPLKCTYNLSCGKHHCQSLCHKGRCLPCYLSSFDELYCECGANKIFPPVPCGTKRPACDKPCSRQHNCDHKVMHNCHSASTCPPCMQFTTKACHGNHEQRKIIPCSTSSFSCGLPCNKPLKCGDHVCAKICHAGLCETESDICKQNCKTVRLNCPHFCNAPCHKGTDCPETSCREMVETLCQCGLRKQMRSCHAFSSEFKKIATAQLASSVQQMQNGGTIELSDILGPIKTSNNKTLECNEECRVAERNRRLAIGLQIRNPDTASKFSPKYSDFIRMWAKKDPKLVTVIHDKLTELVKLAKESKQRSRSHSFPIMNREKRQLVHEMCEMFGVESVAYDAEPNRNVVATAKRDTSWLPSISIIEALQRESQRRIPVPSVTAWGIKRN